MIDYQPKTNTLESEGTDSDNSSNKFWKNDNFSKAWLVIGLLCCSMANANQIHLFSNDDGYIGVVTSEKNAPYVIEGFIENNFLEAVEISNNKANSDGTGQSRLVLPNHHYANSDGTGRPANSDGTGDYGPANSDGTGGSGTANSDGTGGSIISPANSDGTGDKILSVLLACDENSKHIGLQETNDKNITVVFNQIFVDGQKYSCE